MPLRSTFATLLLLNVTSGLAAVETPARFMATMADGSVVENDSLIGWHTASSQPTLDGKPLLDAKNPFRWLRDRRLPPPQVPHAYVETITGDRLPGLVIGYRDGADQPYSPAPPAFVVRPDTNLLPPQSVSDPKIHVVARFVRRLVWQRRESDSFQPSTLFYRDGSSVTFHSIRFANDVVTLLLTTEQRKVSFQEIAEIHLPANDPWQGYLDELAMLCPHGNERLLQLETTDGLIATTSVTRFATSGPSMAVPSDFTRWIHGIQPAWSLEILWVPTGNIVFRRSFAPHEVPLSRLWPVHSEQRSSLAGAGPPWRRNRNVQLGLLHSGGREFGWGFGVHAFSELHFALPPQAVSFRGAVGLDFIAREGGCVQARVFADDVKSPPLFESRLLIGSEKLESIGALSLAGRRRLILQVDPAHDQRPPGADPFNIRDMTNWLDPIVELDQDQLQREIETRLPKLLAALHGWELIVDRTGPPEQRGDIEWFNARDENWPAPGTFQLAILAKNRPLVLQREVQVGSESRWLSLLPIQPAITKQTTRMEVQINGETVFDSTAPLFPRGAAEPAVIAVPLRDYEGHRLSFRVRQFPTPAPMPILWRFAYVAHQLPTLYQAFDDDGDLQGIGAVTAATALQNADRMSGERAIRLTTGQQIQLQLPRPVVIRETPQLGEFRHVRFSVRKSPQGLFALEYHDAARRDRPLRHDGGVGAPAFGRAVRTWADPNSASWISLTRDMYGDFGRSEITAITLTCVAGEMALFDGIYFGRGGEEFSLIPQVAPPLPITEKLHKEIVQPTLAGASPAVVSLKFDDGRFGTGTLIDKDLLVTAGHLLIGPGKEVEIMLAGGEARVGKTLGIAREFDVGLVRLDKPHFRFCHLAQPPVYSDRLNHAGTQHVGLAHAPSPQPNAVPAAQLVEVRRLFRNRFWTDFDPPIYSAGGPLVSQYGHLEAIQIRRDPVGGLVYQRLGDVAKLFPRLMNGEVFGAWPAGCEPELGWKIAWTNGVAVVERVVPTPGKESSVQVGDIIVKLNDRAMGSLADLHAAIAENNPGDEVPVEITRSDQAMSVKAKLTPRLP